MSLDHSATEPILDFLSRIGIPVTIAETAADTFLPGIRIAGGTLILDPARPFHPGDLLHEAGHIALTEAPLRAGLDEVKDDPGEEMAALAWSYAAAHAIGLDPAILFHDQGYKGASQSLIDAFTAPGGGGPGVPMLEWYGMTASARTAARTGRAAFPAMSRWLR